ncbi:sigma-70 family RNA polymerase sigma factor [Lacticaseibacillus nasuensis]|uniref:RNA polymerase sigma-70 region 4 domain-containing protein n=1 Tax=Lacticaseibacillus nasuensis JCM 17158 TaxID=1291734 RepID=A0A0R1JSR3_9LACO|nr:sigma-70 family RNA polymerase sigma factor [Lacticaseibacillus nasuensis]KRK74091.1 hypothetical protein FD02_GL001415 [Lacticaseibacillus nasuensis JCM 17158]
MRSYERAFAFYLAHMGVVVAAVKRLGISPHTAEFDDVVADGMLIYVDYYRRYQDHISTVEEVKQFNQIAGFVVFRTLLRRREDMRKRQQADAERPIDPLAPTVVPSVEADVAVSAALVDFIASLTSEERQVLSQLYDEDSTLAAIPKKLGISMYRVRQIRRSLQKKYVASLHRQH